jgi:hypothetical protein
MSQSLVHSLIDFGMSEVDAWRCVHLMQGRTSVVLLKIEPHDAPAPSSTLPPLNDEMVNAALAHGAAWSQLPDGGWQYLRNVAWCRDELAGLQSDLLGLSSLDTAEAPD